MRKHVAFVTRDIDLDPVMDYINNVAPIVGPNEVSKICKDHKGEVYGYWIMR